MIFYKYTKKSGFINFPGYKSPDNTSKIEKYLDTESILSEMDEIEVDGDSYIINIADGLFYKSVEDGTELYNKSIVVDSIVSGYCKNGLAVFDSTKTDKEEIYHLGKNDHAIMDMTFVTDPIGNIWASVSVLGDDLRYSVEKGYIIYKNKRNNFMNLYIPNAKFTTVVTGGKLDYDKIEAVKNQSARRTMLMARSSNFIDLSQVTTTEDVTANPTKTLTLGSSSSGSLSYIDAIAKHSPDIVQNKKNFPPCVGIDSSGHYMYDYSLDFSKLDMTQFKEDEYLDVDSIIKNYKKNLASYNRFKIAMPDDMLSRGFMHVFFTRPDCNFMENEKLVSRVSSDPFVKYVYKRKPDLLKQLILQNGSSHDFMLLTSNKAKSFNLTDDGIESDRYGKTFGGHSISFARRKSSELGGTFDVTYTDTRDLDIINLHKLWIEYASNVYRGKWTPKLKYIYGKVIDYACSVYVIITAEDFESIIYWTKYYGVYPVNVPYSNLSWNGGTPISNPEVTISYNYSWKEDFNPLSLTELNMNAFRSASTKNAKYLPSYNPKIGHSGSTWVGAPFVETISYKSMTEDPTNGSKYAIKLRFRK